MPGDLINQVSQTGTAINPVDSAASVDSVATALSLQSVIPRPARQQVSSSFAKQNIVARPPVENITPPASGNRVITVAAKDRDRNA